MLEFNEKTKMNFSCILRTRFAPAFHIPFQLQEDFYPVCAALNTPVGIELDKRSPLEEWVNPIAGCGNISCALLVKLVMSRVLN